MTIYFGAEEWDGPLSLFDMMDVKDPEILAYMNNYQVHLIAPAQMADEEIMKFQSSLREVLFFIKYSKNREELARILAANEQRFQGLERRAADVIQAITNIEIKYDEEQEVVDMCQAIKEMIQESFQDGERKGFQDGERKGYQDAYLEFQEMMAERCQDIKFNNARETAMNLYHLGIEVEKISGGVGYNLETVRGWLGLK